MFLDLGQKRDYSDFSGLEVHTIVIIEVESQDDFAELSYHFFFFAVEKDVPKEFVAQDIYWLQADDFDQSHQSF